MTSSITEKVHTCHRCGSEDAVKYVALVNCPNCGKYGLLDPEPSTRKPRTKRVRETVSAEQLQEAIKEAASNEDWEMVVRLSKKLEKVMKG